MTLKPPNTPLQQPSGARTIPVNWEVYCAAHG